MSNTRCIKPRYITPKNAGETVTQKVPCGKCSNCRARLVSSWSHRLMQHEKYCMTAYFLTLTYANDKVPVTRAGFMALSRRDCQLFIKRLRKAHGEDHPNIKYFLVGEYGGRTKRPHYHAILFNARMELIESAWQKGFVHVGNVTGASVGYTMKYMFKPSKIPMHINDDRVPEFRLMSKGLGLGYLTKQMIEWHRADLPNRLYVNIEGGKKASMSRYYKNRIYSKDELKLINEVIKQKAEVIEMPTNKSLADCINADFMRMEKKSLSTKI